MSGYYCWQLGEFKLRPTTKAVRNAAEAAFGNVLEHYKWWKLPLPVMHRLARLCGGGAGGDRIDLDPAALIKTLSRMFATGPKGWTKGSATHLDCYVLW